MENSDEFCPTDTLQSDIVVWCVTAREVNQRVAQ